MAPGHIHYLRLLIVLVLAGCGAADALLPLHALCKYQARGEGSRPLVRQRSFSFHPPPSGVLLPEGRPQQQRRSQEKDPLASPDSFSSRSLSQRLDRPHKFKSILARGLEVSGKSKGLPRGDKGLLLGDKELLRGDKGLPRGYKELPNKDNGSPRSNIGSPSVRQVRRTHRSAEKIAPEVIPEKHETKDFPSLVEDSFLPSKLPPVKQVSPFEVPNIGKIEPFKLEEESDVSSLGEDHGDGISSHYVAVGGFTSLLPHSSVPGEDEPDGFLPRLIPIGEAPGHKSPNFPLALPNRKSPTAQSPVKSSKGKSPSFPSPVIPLGHKFPSPALRGDPVNKSLNPPVSILRGEPHKGGQPLPGPPPEIPEADHPLGQSSPISPPLRKSPTQLPPYPPPRLKSSIPDNSPGKSPLPPPKLSVTDSHPHKTPTVRKTPVTPTVAKSPLPAPHAKSTSPALGLTATSLSTKHTFPDLSDEGPVTPTITIATPLELPTYKIGPNGIELQGGQTGAPLTRGPPLVTPFNPFTTLVLPGYGQTLGGRQTYYHLPLQIPLLNFPGGGGSQAF